MSGSAPLRGKRRLHLMLSKEVHGAVEVRCELEGKTRSEFVEEAVRLSLSVRDRESFERRNGLGSRMRDLEEAVFSVRELVGELGLRNLYASERTYAIFELQFGERLAASRRDAHEVARGRLDPGESGDGSASRRDSFSERGGN